MSLVQVVCENGHDIIPESRTVVYEVPPLSMQIAYREAICEAS